MSGREYCAVVVQRRVFVCRRAAFDVTKDVQISKSVPRREREREQVARTASRARNLHHLRVGRVATVDWALSPCYLFYEILIQRDESSGDSNSLFMRR